MRAWAPACSVHGARFDRAAWRLESGARDRVIGMGSGRLGKVPHVFTSDVVAFSVVTYLPAFVEQAEIKVLFEAS